MDGYKVMKILYFVAVMIGVMLKLPAIFADWTKTSVMDVKIVEYTNQILPSEWGEKDIDATAVIKFTDNCSILNSQVIVKLTRIDGKIIYLDYDNPAFKVGTNEYHFSIYTSDINKSELGGTNGVLYLKLYAKILANCSGTLYTYEGSDSVPIAIGSYEGKEYLDILSIAPNFNVLNHLDNKKYDVHIKVANYGLEKVYDGYLKLYLKDYADNSIIKLTKAFSLEAGDEKEFSFNLDLTSVKPGKYKIVIELWKGNVLEDERVYNVSVAMDKIKALEFYDFQLIPDKIKPGDLVMADLVIKNVLDKPVTVKPILISDDLNLYRELQEFTLDPNEAKEFKVVFPVNVKEPGNYKVTLKFIYDVYKTETYDFYVNIPGEKKIIEATLTGPSVINVTGEGVLTLKIKSLVEDLIPVKIDIDSNTNVIPEKSEIYVGGIGFEREIKLFVSPKTPGTKQITVHLIDDRTGKELGNVTYTINVIGAKVKQKLVNESEESNIPTLLSNKLLLSGIIVALIIILALIILLKDRKKGGEEQPTA